MRLITINYGPPESIRWSFDQSVYALCEWWLNTAS